MDNPNVTNMEGEAVNVMAGHEQAEIAQMLPQALLALGGPGTRLASGYNNGQAAMRAHLEQTMGVNELDADKLVKMLIQTNHLQFVGKGEQPPAPTGQANPSSELDRMVSNADAGDSFGGEGQVSAATSTSSGDVAVVPNPGNVAYNPLVNVAPEMAPGNVMSAPTVPNEANVESARREGTAVAGARFAPAAVGGTAGYHNAGLMTAPYPIDKDNSDAAGEWYLVS
jgi:hypothetical protein